MKKIVATLILMFFVNSVGFAVQFDASIDSQIRETYDIEESSLPPLPNADAESYQQNEVKKETIKYNPTGEVYTLKRGTVINLTSLSNISNWTRKGSKVSFEASSGFLSKEGKPIPAGTILKGTIVDSHPPQMTGNGGLIELKIDEIYLNGVVSYIDTKVSLANSKKIFLDNIKGERKYWKNMGKAMTPGRKTFNATQKVANIMRPILVVGILSPIPLLCGSVVYTLNLVASPVVSIFMKGGAINLPAGTDFQVKLTKEAQING